MLKKLLPALLLGAAGFGAGALAARPAAEPVTVPLLRAAQELLGLHFTDAQLDSARGPIGRNRASYEELRKISLSNSVAPTLVFDPVPLRLRLAAPAGKPGPDRMVPIGKIKILTNRDELAFHTVRQLGELLRTKQVSSEELTDFFLARLRKYSPKLECVTTLTEELAHQQARAVVAVHPGE